MKICIVTHTFPRFKDDTTAPFMHILVEALRKAKHEVVVLTPYTEALQKEDFPYEIVTYKYIWPSFFHRLGYSNTLQAGTYLKRETYVLSPFLYFFGMVALLRLCRERKFTIISAHWILPNGFLACTVSKLLKIPYVITLPGSDVYVAGRNRVFSQMAIIAAGGAGAIIADSPQFLENLKSLGANVKKSEVIPYPVDEEAFKPRQTKRSTIRTSLHIAPDEIVCMSVGRLVYKKGFSVLLHAVASLIPKGNRIKLVIIGDGDLQEELRNLARTLRITKNTIFLYRIKRRDMIDYYNLADIFISTAIKDKEGNIDDAPVSLFEAMACGRPIVATNFPGIAAIVEHGINGYLLPEKNVEELTRALVLLITSSRRRKMMGNESRRIAKEKLSRMTIGYRYTKIFTDVFKNHL